MRVRVVLMVKIIFKIFDHIIALINILGTIITIIGAIKIFFYNKNYFLYIVGGWALFLFVTSTFLYMRWLREHSRLRALRILSHRGKVNTINYMVYLDFLNHKFHDDYDNDPKTNSLVITRSEFTFHFFNSDSGNQIIDVDYRHTFHLIKHGKKFDALILHSIGELVRSPQEDLGTFIKYQNKYYSIIPEPCIGDMRNQNNQVLDRVQCSLPAMIDREETLEFHYRINGEFNTVDDDVFVIYPQNYGKKFNNTATFQLSFDDPYFADIQLLTLPYDYTVGGAIQYVAQFENNDEGKTYRCTVKSLKDRNIYLISIRHRPLL